jgi:hypothetical protein
VPAPDAPPAFNAIEVRERLRAIDLHACKADNGDDGALAGFGHARITFKPEGRVKAVVIDGPAGLSDNAVACIGERLGAVQVPAFRGGEVTAGYVYHVE